MPTIEQLEELLGKEPDDIFLNFGIAMALSKDGQVEAALGRFRRTIELDADYVAAYFHQGRLLADNGDAGAARAVLLEGAEAAVRAGEARARQEIEDLLSTLD